MTKVTATSLGEQMWPPTFFGVLGMLRGFSFWKKHIVFCRNYKCELWDFQMFIYIYIHKDDVHMFWMYIFSVCTKKLAQKFGQRKSQIWIRDPQQSNYLLWGVTHPAWIRFFFSPAVNSNPGLPFGKYLGRILWYLVTGMSCRYLVTGWFHPYKSRLFTSLK